MSIFASETKSGPIAIPFDPPHTIVVRALTGREVDLAQGEHLRGLINGRSSRGWAATFAKALANGAATEADAEKALRDPLNGYDRHTIVACGLQSWTYTNPAAKDGTDPHTPSDKQIADLADEALEFIAIEVMKLTKPRLFESTQHNG